MKMLTVLSIVAMVATVFCLPLSAAETPGVASTGPDEATVKTYLEKKVPGDTGSCLLDNIKIQIIGISDVVPGHQAEVFYKFEYKLRCNRGSESKDGQGVLSVFRLRDGNWIDRETFALIAK